MSHAPSRVKTYIFVLLMVIFGPLGNVLLRKGMKTIGPLPGSSPEQFLQFAGVVLSSRTIWLGIACLIAFFVAQMLVLTWADYSWVLPASAVACASVALMGHFLLGEAVAPVRWIGILVVCLGVFVVGQTPHSTTKEKNSL
jgi:drug/metabolite transporter (DMT)-like permease